jgi:hypothetical protein
MSIAAVSAHSFCQNPAQNLLSGPKRAQDPFTLPDQAPIPGHPPSLQGQPAFNVLAAQSGTPLKSQPEFNVLAGQSSNPLQSGPEFNVLAGQSFAALQGQPELNVLNYSIPEL